MTHERNAVVQAVNSTPNLNEAANQLGASRRTLQNRMREYSLPYGQAGRRKQELPYQDEGDGGLLLLAALGLGGLAYAWWRSRPSQQTILGGDIGKTEDLRGLDVILGHYKSSSIAQRWRLGR